MQQYYDPYAAAQQYAPQGYAGDQGGGMAGQYHPYAAGPDFAPQGIFGSALGAIAGPLGGLIGGRFGRPGMGRTIGRTVGQFAHFLPFNAEPEFGPQGYGGDPAGAGMPAQYLPYGADPQFSPQGRIGNFFGNIAPDLGRAIGGQFGNANMGQQIGTLAGNLGRRFIPFDAGPEDYAPQGYADPAAAGMEHQYLPYGAEAQFAPQGWGWLGNLASTVRRTLPIAKQVRRFLPFGAEADFAAPGYGDPAAGGIGQQYLPYGAEAQFAPQGWFGNMVGNIAPTVGGMIGGRFGNPNLGRQVGGWAGAAARRFIPFGAGQEDYAPQGYGDPAAGGTGQQYHPYGAEAQFAPQGWFGNMVGNIAPTVGGMIGGRFGNPNLGRQVGGWAGTAARRFIPFGADPYDPYMQQGWGAS